MRIWDVDQAEHYIQFLKTKMQELADTPDKGRPIAGRPGLRSHVAKWKSAKHGHRIVYEETPDGIFILRVIHTAMNWTEQI